MDMTLKNLKKMITKSVKLCRTRKQLLKLLIEVTKAGKKAGIK